MAVCGWCGKRGLDPNRHPDDPQGHWTPKNAPCRGLGTYQARAVESVKGAAPRV